ncbi:hypothetical protein R1flu_002149 [Riccia fluitans]|uniref:F-box domain-containing protein n=1 Tax=Riccia fluitans TaxID=41844 RepID=A0ABD1Y5B0_9MARC
MCQCSKPRVDLDCERSFLYGLKLRGGFDGSTFPGRSRRRSAKGSRYRTAAQSRSTSPESEDYKVEEESDRTESSTEGSDLDVVDKHRHHLKELPEVLVERIMTGIPFPDVLKVRELSREWRSKFSRVVIEEGSAIDSTRSWPEYFPTFLSKERSRVEGYDPVRSFEKHVEGVQTTSAEGGSGPGGDWDVRVTGYGSLLVVFNLDYRHGQPFATVTNLVTRRKKELIWPIRPLEGSDRFYSFSWPILVFLGSDDYQLVSWYYEVEKISFQRKSTHFLVYNSSSATWIERSYPSDCIKDCYYGAYMDGSVYYILKPQAQNQPRIVRFNVMSGARTETGPIEQDDPLNGDWVHSTVVRCDRRIMAVMFEHNGYSFKVKILQLKMDSFEFVKLSEYSMSSKNLPISFYDIPVVASSGCIYILQLYTPVLTTFHVNSNTWTSTTSIPEKFCKLEVRRNLFVFETGLYPFVAP